MKNAYLFLISFLLSCSPSQTDTSTKVSNKKEDKLATTTKSNTTLMKLISSLPEVDIYHTTFSYEDQHLKDDLFIDSLAFKSIYQNDSLLQKYNPQSDYGYFIGKQVQENFISLIIARAYGEWIKSLELLTYSKEGEMIDFMFLAHVGGDLEEYTEAKGSFSNDSIYSLITITKNAQDIADLTNGDHDKIVFDTVITYSVLHRDGSITELSN